MSIASEIEMKDKGAIYIEWNLSLSGYFLSVLRAPRMAARSQDLAVEKTQADGAPCAHTHRHHQGVHPS